MPFFYVATDRIFDVGMLHNVIAKQFHIHTHCGFIYRETNSHLLRWSSMYVLWVPKGVVLIKIIPSRKQHSGTQLLNIVGGVDVL